MTEHSILQEISMLTGLSRAELTRLARDAPLRYKHFVIPKKGSGTRYISQPSRALKIVQRATVEVLEKFLPVHDCAMAYRKERSIADNARRHAGNGAIMKVDFKDFFPSIKYQDWLFFALNRTPFSPLELEICGKFLFHKPQKRGGGLCLAIGAPSSPFISNAMLYNFDSVVSERLTLKRIVYTRYADDLTFSAQRTGFLHEVMPVVQLALSESGPPRLRINETKTKVVTPKYNRIVTGVTLTNQGGISVGLSRRRKIRALIHNLSIKIKQNGGYVPPPSIEQDIGNIAFVAMIEPAFFQKLKIKYGGHVIDAIMKLAHRTER